MRRWTPATSHSLRLSPGGNFPQCWLAQIHPLDRLQILKIREHALRGRLYEETLNPAVSPGHVDCAKLAPIRTHLRETQAAWVTGDLAADLLAIWKRSQCSGKFKPTVTGRYLATHFPTRPRVRLTGSGAWGAGRGELLWGSTGSAGSGSSGCLQMASSHSRDPWECGFPLSQPGVPQASWRLSRTSCLIPGRTCLKNFHFTPGSSQVKGQLCRRLVIPPCLGVWGSAFGGRKGRG